MQNIAIFGSGSGTNAENIIRYFAKSDTIRVAVVISNKKDAGIHLRAKNLNVPSFTFSSSEFREGDLIVDKLAEFQVDFVVLAGFLLLISPVIIRSFQGRIINIHPALLPKFGGKGMYGSYVHEAVVAAKETSTGITIHYVNERYDDGAVIFQATCPVAPHDTPDKVAAKVHALEYQYFPVVIERLLLGQSIKNPSLTQRHRGHRESQRMIIEDKLSERFYEIFEQATRDYHLEDDINAACLNPYKEETISFALYRKNRIDAVQWHLEDIIRAPDINPVEALTIKRRIDKLNQERTDLVEWIDGYFLNLYKDVEVLANATINTESPAWAVDRLSILALKIYHIRLETERLDASEEHLEKCKEKLAVLMEQKNDLTIALDQLLHDYAEGRKYMKVYKQMKMYNDPALNPILYNKKTNG